jgi:hypothetical protein
MGTFFYVQWLLFTKHDYPLGLKKLADLLRREDMHELERAQLRAWLAELLDPKDNHYDFKLIAKKTGRGAKHTSRMRAQADLAHDVKVAMEREGLNKGQALEKVAPGRTRQANRDIAEHRRRNSRFRIFPKD